MLTDLEVVGARIDWDYHATLQTAFPQQMDVILSEVRGYPQVALASRYHGQHKKKPTEGEPFNINSPVQVSTLVFDVLGLPAVGKKTKAGKDSTGKDNVAEWLEMLEPGSDAADILTKIQRWKQLSKLYSGYIEPLPSFMGRDGHIHTRFNQGFVATWRLSSQEPNLQQLPRNDDAAASEEDSIGKGSIKRMFIGGQPGWWVAEADYSQIELRTAGLISQDKGFIENYERGEDLHSRTACEIFNVHPDDLQKAQRSAAKTINFGILFGMEAPALARRLRISIREAERMIKAFWTAYPGFDSWVKGTTEFLREHHYVESMFGHRRHLPNVAARDSGISSHAERQGFNFPIQCTASNLTMYAEMFINDIFKEEEMQSYCFGQVHDSVWLTGPPSERDKALTIVKVVMENPGFPFLIGDDPRWPVPVPIVADVNVGMNLRDLKPWTMPS
jgi:DNA polymerase-1